LEKIADTNTRRRTEKCGKHQWIMMVKYVKKVNRLLKMNINIYFLHKNLVNIGTRKEMQYA
jgi:hypothetical protein